jgi:hypothetical protein
VGNVGANNHKHSQAKFREEYLHNYVDSRTVQNWILSISETIVICIMSKNVILIHKKTKLIAVINVGILIPCFKNK